MHSASLLLRPAFGCLLLHPSCCTLTPKCISNTIDTLKLHPQAPKKQARFPQPGCQAEKSSASAPQAQRHHSVAVGPSPPVYKNRLSRRPLADKVSTLIHLFIPTSPLPNLNTFATWSLGEHVSEGGCRCWSGKRQPVRRRAYCSWSGLGNCAPGLYDGDLVGGGSGPPLEYTQ